MRSSRREVLLLVGVGGVCVVYALGLGLYYIRSGIGEILFWEKRERRLTLHKARARWLRRRDKPVLPEQLNVFAAQVAGHTGEVLKLLAPFYVLKPMLKEEQSYREIVFYEDVASMPAAYYESPLQFIPPYYGVVSLKTQQRSIDYLVLKDLCGRFKKPCVIDIKIGRRTYALNASEGKIKYELSKYPFQQDIGFRITGMRVYDITSRSYWRVGKKFGRKVTPENVKQCLATFFYNGAFARTDVLTAALARLSHLHSWSERQTRYSFVSSSILIMYDGQIDTNPSSSITTDSPETQPGVPDNLVKREALTPYNEVDFTNDEAVHEHIRTRSPWAHARPNPAGAGSLVIGGPRRSHISVGDSWQPMSIAEAVDVRVVDFAHVTKEHDREQNFTFGVRKLMGSLRQILQELPVHTHPDTHTEMITPMHSTRVALKRFGGPLE